LERFDNRDLQRTQHLNGFKENISPPWATIGSRGLRCGAVQPQRLWREQGRLVNHSFGDVSGGIHTKHGGRENRARIVERRSIR
jgi:hypothetical protein